jgi:transcriptional regulator with XRE-family HTH domain
MDADTYAQERQLMLDQFGAALRRAREDKDLSQEELGDHCGLHRTEISLPERGLRAPRLCTLLVVAAELDLPVEALVAHLLVPKTRLQRKRSRDYRH